MEKRFYQRCVLHARRTPYHMIFLVHSLKIAKTAGRLVKTPRKQQQGTWADFFSCSFTPVFNRLEAKEDNNFHGVFRIRIFPAYSQHNPRSKTPLSSIQQTAF